MSGAETRFRVRKDVVCSRVSEGAVLLSTSEEVYYGLNEVGYLIWEGLEEGASVSNLCGRIERRFPDVGAETVRSDVVELLDDLEGHGLVERDEDGGDAG